jgi:hypothetical protein
MTKEMTTRGRVALGGSYKRNNYRYRRFQALSDSLDVYFLLLNARRKWWTVEEVCKGLELDPLDAAVCKRIRRIGQALARIHRIEYQHLSNTEAFPIRCRAYMRLAA